MVKKLRYFIFIIVITLLISVLALAAHVITPSTYENGFGFSVNENITNIFNFTINNTFIGQINNVSQVNFTLPGNFVFVAGTNITSTNEITATFSNTTGSGTIVTWTGSPYLINGSITGFGNWSFFTFNATTTIPGTYNITVTTLNGSTTTSQNVSVQVNDTTAPHNMSFVGITPVANANLSQNYFSINVSVNDSDGTYSGALDTIRILVFYGNGTLYNSTNTTTNNNLINFTSLSNGVYIVNVTTNDTKGNVNSTAISRNITIDTSNPSASFSCDATNVARSALITCSCSGSDSGSGVQSTSYTTNPSTSESGTFQTSCIVTDYAGNVGNSTIVYIVVGGSGGGSSGGGSGTTDSFWDTTKIVPSDKFTLGYTDTLGKKHRARITIGSETHYVGVTEITSTTATINVSSEPQIATLSVGDERKFNVTSNNFYDVKVTLNSISDNKANLTIVSINEEITPTIEEEQAQADQAAQETQEEELGSSRDMKKLWITLLVIVILLAIVGAGYFLFRYKYKFD